MNGTADYGVVPHGPALDIQGPITLAAWVRPTRVATQYVLKKATLNGANGYELALSDAGKVFFRLNQLASSNTFRLNSTSSYPTNGTWTHVAATYDGSSMRLYVNGVEEGTIDGPSAILGNTRPLGIGAQANGVSPLNGAMDEAAIWSRSLSAAEIEALATPPTPDPQPQMPITHVAQRGSLNDGSATSHVVTLTNPTDISVGNHLIARIGKVQNRTLSSVTDPRGNTWQVDHQENNGASFTQVVLSSRITTAYRAGDTISFNFSGTGQPAGVVIDEFSGLADSRWLDQKSSFLTTPAATSFASGEVTATQDDELQLGVIVAQGVTPPTFTPASLTPEWNVLGWAEGTSFARAVGGAYRVVSAIETRQFSGSITSRISLATILTYTTEAGPPEIDYQWSGGVTEGSAAVAVRIKDTGSGAMDVRIAVSTSPSMASPTYTSEVTADSANDWTGKGEFSGLVGNTQYYYQAEIDGTLSGVTGKFKTLGAASYSIAFASCSASASNHQVFDRIRDRDPLMFVHLGDRHYANVATNNVTLYRAAMNGAFTARQKGLWQNVPSAYIWDDHDWGGNNSHGGNPGKPAARSVYAEKVPHYSLTGSGAVYQAWSIGRVRYIFTDNRYERSNPANTDNSSKTILGATQKQWLKDELLAAKNTHALIVWLQGTSWVFPTTAGSDRWGGYTTERTEIANFVKDNGLTGKVVTVGGDLHLLAIDDGSNGDYATGGGAAIRSFAVAPLDQAQLSTTPPTYSEGSFLNPSGTGQYGTMDVVDNGTNLEVTWTGWRVSTAGVESQLVTYSFAAVEHAPVGRSQEISWEIAAFNDALQPGALQPGPF